MQRLLTFCSIVSLLVCALVCVLWVQSPRVGYILMTNPTDRRHINAASFVYGPALLVRASVER